MFKPSRVLNEFSGFMGLQVWDLAGVGYTLVISYQLLLPFGLEVLSFLISGLLGFLILQIRLSCRRKVIRDFISYYLRRIFK